MEAEVVDVQTLHTLKGKLLTSHGSVVFKIITLGDKLTTVSNSVMTCTFSVLVV